MLKMCTPAQNRTPSCLTIFPEQGSSANGRLKVLLESNVLSIDGDTVQIEQHGKTIKLQNEAVIVCAGGILPTGFLKEIGIEVETKFGTA